MRARRPLVALLLLSCGAAGCAPSPAGPEAPVTFARVSPADSLKAAGARGAALAFVRAYAGASKDGGHALARLVGTPQLRDWVHWVDVQDAEFQGTISASVQTAEIGPAVPFSVSTVPGSEEILREVDVRATVVFSVAPVHGEPSQLTRSLDGPMRLIQNPDDGEWTVLDFTRDGIPLSAQFQALTGRAMALANGVEVNLDSFQSIPYWQFGVIVRSSAPSGLAAHDAELVDASGKVVTAAQTVTVSLTKIKAGTPAEGLVTFPPQSSAGGLSIRLTFRGRGVPSTRVELPLGDLIKPIPLQPASSASPGP